MTRPFKPGRQISKLIICSCVWYLHVNIKYLVMINFQNQLFSCLIDFKLLYNVVASVEYPILPRLKRTFYNIQYALHYLILQLKVKYMCVDICEDHMMQAF